MSLQPRYASRLHEKFPDLSAVFFDEWTPMTHIDFRDGILFVPEVLLAANAMKAGMSILRPLLAETGAPKVGKMIIGRRSTSTRLTSSVCRPCSRPPCPT
jgi:hypothetical protein